MNARYEELIGTYVDNKVGICEQFLSNDLALLLRQNLIKLEKAEMMRSAGIGNNQDADAKQQWRGDKIFWIDNDTNEVSERAFLDQVDDFILYLNNSCYTGINAYEFHYALYETGSSYQRHRDQFQNNTERKFSLINYLNTDWLEEEGGELWVYQEGSTVKILPLMQKAVFFKSDFSEHEVRKSTRPRMSITGWLKSC